MTKVNILSPLNINGEKLKKFLHKSFGKYQEFETETFSISKNGSFEAGGYNEIHLESDDSRFALNRRDLISHCIETKQEEKLSFMELSINNSTLPL